MAVRSRGHRLLRYQIATEFSGFGEAGTLEVVKRTPKVFVFSGQGSQTATMGHQLYRSSRAYREAIDGVDEAYKRVTGESFITATGLFVSADEVAAVHDVAYSLIALFAYQYAAVALLRSAGVEPAAVVGHSVGELAAYTVNGTMALEDTVYFIWKRGQVFKQCDGRGGMMAVTRCSSLEAILELEGMWVSAYNSPTSPGGTRAPSARRRCVRRRGAFTNGWP